MSAGNVNLPGELEPEKLALIQQILATQYVEPPLEERIAEAERLTTLMVRLLPFLGETIRIKKDATVQGIVKRFDTEERRETFDEFKARHCPHEILLQVGECYRLGKCGTRPGDVFLTPIQETFERQMRVQVSESFVSSVELDIKK